MKKNEKIITLLNELLADELTAICQYMVHAEMCSNWGYVKLGAAVRQRAITEMKHAEKLIERILFLEGKPEIGRTGAIEIGHDLEQQFRNDRGSEAGASKAYNNAIRFAAEACDNGTADLLRSILSDEEIHFDWLDTQLHLLEQLGNKNYLAQQVN